MTNAKERLLTVLKGKPADRVPCICPGGMMNMVITQLMEKTGIGWPKAHLDPSLMANLAEAVYTSGMFENYGVPFCMTVEAESLGAGVNMGDMRFEPRVVEYALDSVSQYRELELRSLASGRAKVTTDAIALLKQKDPTVPVVGNLSGPISVASSIMEPIVYYKELRKSPEDAHAYMALVTKQILEFGLAQIRAGADVITISDPSGTGELLGPKFFREYAVKYINMLIDGMRQEFPEIPVIVHICGKMHTVYEELNELKADAYSFDAVVSIREIRKFMPDRILMGNVSTFALEMADTERVALMTKNVMKSGIDIVSPACGLGTSSSLENIQAILKTVQAETGIQ